MIYYFCVQSSIGGLIRLSIHMIPFERQLKRYFFMLTKNRKHQLRISALLKSNNIAFSSGISSPSILYDSFS